MFPSFAHLSHGEVRGLLLLRCGRVLPLVLLLVLVHVPLHRVLRRLLQRRLRLLRRLLRRGLSLHLLAQQGDVLDAFQLAGVSQEPEIEGKI